MIGVAANPNEWDAAREFFELFKTPWEPAVAGRPYRAVVSTIGRPAGVESSLLLAYGDGQLNVDRAAGVRTDRMPALRRAEWAGASFPIYRGAAAFDGRGPSTLAGSGRALDYSGSTTGCRFRRFGYNLFEEVQHLLTEGQPTSDALTPTLDLHVGLLREALTDSGVPFVEVLPHPSGYDFVCCLTHDIDFFGLRRHVLDRTLAGFVARASVGSLVDVIRRRRTVDEALRNWVALLSLPFVYLGVLSDPWRPLDDYERADAARPSTFFLVPYRGRAGVRPHGGTDASRSVKYDVADVSAALQSAAARGRELAVHGIDAWRDEEAGRAEMGRVARLAGRETAGVRMHWLYFASDSPTRLERAGFDYDSTSGYNDAVGYRAGTSQVYRLPGTRGLMELPIAIMDTALFYADRLGLSRPEALERCRAIIGHARRAGGTVVVNWHDRSLAPERLWGRAYAELLQELDGGAPWFATAADAVEWFRWRRAVTFEAAPGGAVVVHSGPLRPGFPGAVVAVRRPGTRTEERLVLAGGEAQRVEP